MNSQYVNDEQASAIKGCKRMIEWANSILAQPNVQYPNGRWSHDNARAELYKVQDKLLDLPVWSAEGTILLD